MRQWAPPVAGTMVALVLLVGTAATTGIAAGCVALDYQATLSAASGALHGSPPDVAGAERGVTALLAADPTRSLALQPISADLAAQPPDIADAQLRLDSMSAALAYPPGSTCNEDSGPARTTLHDVYASPPFRHLDDVQQSTLLTSVLNFLGSVVNRAAGAIGQLGAVLLILVVVAVAAVIAVRRWRDASLTRAQSLDEPFTVSDDPDAEWRAAEQAAAAGNFREAVRRGFRSALLDVAVRGNVHLDPAWTTRELLEHCNADGDVLLALAGAATLFDHAWYSGMVVTRSDWDLAAERCSALRTLARRRRAAVT